MGVGTRPRIDFRGMKLATMGASIKLQSRKMMINTYMRCEGMRYSKFVMTDRAGKRYMRERFRNFRNDLNDLQ